MTLIGAILRKVQSKDSLASKKFSSPPPEYQENILKPKPKKKAVFKYGHVCSAVDARPPRYDTRCMRLRVAEWRRNHNQLALENTSLLMAIRRAHFKRGQVDSRWETLPPPCTHSFAARFRFVQRVNRDNKDLYKLITSTGPKVASATSLRRDWARNRADILRRAQASFVLFPPVPRVELEDPAFRAPKGVKRPRVYLTLRFRGGAELGELRAELFADVCPLTCRLFRELLAGDGLGHGYVGTQFFRKVPNLFWSGGDVIYDNGFGCYAQRGRVRPIGAENYHFSHSMPGLLSMRMTPDDEMCGAFNLTFKPLPQLDLKNVVFGRIIRPCATYNAVLELGSPLTKYPVVEVSAARWRAGGAWARGAPNTRLEAGQLSMLRRALASSSAREPA